MAMPISKHQWNTRRLYTENGQRIAVELVEGEGIYFKDIDRGICGWIPWRGVIGSVYDLEEVVMFCYDRLHYESTSKELEYENH